jgi:hypothetical protein
MLRLLGWVVEDKVGSFEGDVTAWLMSNEVRYRRPGCSPPSNRRVEVSALDF